MKLIIDIPSYDKEWITNGYYIPEEINIRISEAIANGTPLDDVKAEIEDLDRFYDNDYFSGNRDSMFKCNEIMKILDNIGKAEKGGE